MDPSQLPPPDLRDSAGRMKRIIVALLVGASTGAIGYMIANALITERREKLIITSGQMNASTFIIYVGLIAGVVGLVVALAIQNTLAKRKWKAEQMPRASVHKPE